MNQRIESKLRRIALDRSGKYEHGLLSWVRMDDNIYATFIRRDKSGDFTKIYEVYKIDWLI